MKRVFELFHVSLLPRPRDMFDDGDDLTREEWLRKSLADQFQFVHRKKDFHWVPRSVADGDVIGIVVRQTEHLHHHPPDQGGTEIVEREWQGAVVVVDPTPHDTGQRVAFERDSAVGGAGPVLSSMLDHINGRHDAQYIIESKPIFDTATFWTFANKHNQVLRRITFDFVIPNMWGTRSNLEKELRGTGNETGAQKAKVDLSSKDGVRTDNDRVKDGVEYAGDGGGSVTARALDGERFTSSNSKATTQIEEDEIESAEQVSVWRKLSSKILHRNE